MPSDLPERIKELERKMGEITRLVGEIKTPKESKPVVDSFVSKNIRLENINGLFQTISSVPTHVPRNFKEQIVLVDSGSITKMYIRFGSTWKLQRFYNT